MANANTRIAELTAQLQNQQRAAHLRFGLLLVLMAGLALTVWLRPVAQPGQPVIIGEPGGRALLTVDGDTPMLRLEAGQATVQLSARPDGTAVLLLSDGVYQRQAILDAQGLRLQQAGLRTRPARQGGERRP